MCAVINLMTLWVKWHVHVYEPSLYDGEKSRIGDFVSDLFGKRANPEP